MPGVAMGDCHVRDDVVDVAAPVELHVGTATRVGGVGGGEGAGKSSLVVGPGDAGGGRNLRRRSLRSG